MAVQTVSWVRAAASRSRCLSLATDLFDRVQVGEYLGSRNSLLTTVLHVSAGACSLAILA